MLRFLNEGGHLLDDWTSFSGEGRTLEGKPPQPQQRMKVSDLEPLSATASSESWG